MATKEQVVPAVVGEVFSLRTNPIMDPKERQDFTVGPKCDKDAGRWICLTHDKVFVNNFEKDSHLAGHAGGRRNAKHVLAWFCAHHGPEVP